MLTSLEYDRVKTGESSGIGGLKILWKIERQSQYPNNPDPQKTDSQPN